MAVFKSFKATAEAVAKNLRQQHAKKKKNILYPGALGKVHPEELRDVLKQMFAAITELQDGSSMATTIDADDGAPAHKSLAPLIDGQYIRYESPGPEAWVNFDHDLGRKPIAAVFLNHHGFDKLVTREITGLPSTYRQTDDTVALVASYSPKGYPVLVLIW